MISHNCDDDRNGIIVIEYELTGCVGFSVFVGFWELLK
jgi:hypothetical protein